MPYPGYKYNYKDNDYLAHVIHEVTSPTFRTSAEKEAFIRRTMRQQEEFMAHLDTQGILEELNEELLQGKGVVGFEYGGWGTGLFLQTDPSAGKNSPRLMIGLVGDRKKLDAGEEDYMTHMAILYVDDNSGIAMEQAYKDSTKAPYRLPIVVDPSLNPDKYTPEQWDKFHDNTKERASKILKQKLEEGPVIRPRGETSDVVELTTWTTDHFRDFDFIKRIVDNNGGPHVGTTAEKEAFIRRTMRQQEEYLGQFHVNAILEQLNRTLLQGKGEISLLYGGTRHYWETTQTSLCLQVDPSQDRNSPRLMIGLVGDKNKFAAGEEDYMTHLGVMYVDKSSDENLEQVEKRVLVDPASYEIDPSLKIGTYAPDTIAGIQEALEQRATTLLKRKLAEQKRKNPVRRLRRLGKIARPIGAVGGAIGVVAGGAAAIESRTQVWENVIEPALRRIIP